jgi:hypothetical protein
MTTPEQNILDVAKAIHLQRLVQLGYSDSYIAKALKAGTPTDYDIELARAAISAIPSGWRDAPIPMVLHCPQCHLQHIDAPDERTPEWTNPPHKSHLCHGCGCIWRPCDRPTDGVSAIQTRGKADTWPPVPIKGSDQ